jgi:hypothetical protein
MRLIDDNGESNFSDDRRRQGPRVGPIPLINRSHQLVSEIFRRSSSAVATSRAGHRLPIRQGQAGAGIGERRYAADLGSANVFNRHFGGRPSIAFTRHM